MNDYAKDLWDGVDDPLGKPMRGSKKKNHSGKKVNWWPANISVCVLVFFVFSIVMAFRTADKNTRKIFITAESYDCPAPGGTGTWQEVYLEIYYNKDCVVTIRTEKDNGTVVEKVYDKDISKHEMEMLQLMFVKTYVWEASSPNQEDAENFHMQVYDNDGVCRRELWGYGKGDSIQQDVEYLLDIMDPRGDRRRG